jgi:hypothetical protein
LTKKKELKPKPKPPLELLGELKCLLIDTKIPLVALKIEELEAVLMMQKEITDDVRLAIAEHLEKHGWNVILVAESGVKQGSDKFKYEYFMKFLGKQREEKKPNETQV